MANLDYGRFLKILALTASSQDGEALSAIRQANRMLASAGMGWQHVVQAMPLYRDPERPTNNFWGDELRAKQAEREERYKADTRTTDELWETGWRENTRGTAWTPGPDPVDEEAELDAQAMAAGVADEKQAMNLYVFAVTEPSLCAWLHDNRSKNTFARLLFQQILEDGDLSDPQKVVVRRLVLRSNRKG
jgi:hypothetical protein